jgi:hypothetical protein
MLQPAYELQCNERLLTLHANSIATTRLREVWQCFVRKTKPFVQANEVALVLERVGMLALIGYEKLE